MTGDFERWLKERELEAKSMRGFNPPQPQRASVESDVLVPVLQSLAIGTVGGLAAGTLTVLVGFGQPGWARWMLAGKVCAGGFVFALAGCTTVFILDHHRVSVVEPIKMAWERIWAAMGAARPRPEDEPTPLVLRGYAKEIPANVAHEIKSIEPDVDPKVKEMYDFITSMWPTDDVTQANCKDRGWSRKYWDKYIGGQRTKRGLESGRGILDRAGVVRKDGGKWVIVAPLNEALAINDDLLRYAEAKARLVSLSPTLPKSVTAGKSTGVT